MDNRDSVVVCATGTLLESIESCSSGKSYATDEGLEPPGDSHVTTSAGMQSAEGGAGAEANGSLSAVARPWFWCLISTGELVCRGLSPLCAVVAESTRKCFSVGTRFVLSFSASSSCPLSNHSLMTRVLRDGRGEASATRPTRRGRSGMEVVSWSSAGFGHAPTHEHAGQSACNRGVQKLRNCTNLFISSVSSSTTAGSSDAEKKHDGWEAKSDMCSCY
jgi:hypothetical protein